MIELNQNELEVLGILWAEGALKPAEIQAKFSRPIENATLRSVLMVLVRQGHIAREKRGKAFFYEARKPPRGLMSKMTQQMARLFSRGSTGALIAQLIRSENLTPEEIQELRRIAEEKVSKPQRSD